jgi:short-subunit dehydrogenase
VAERLAARGASLVLAARTASPPRGVGCRVVECDLAEERGLSALLEAVRAAGPLDGIVHAAGAIHYEAFETMPEAELRRLFELNFFSVLRLTRALLPELEARPGSVVCVVSSVAAWRSLPLWSAYCASKAALTMWTESLRLEVASTGVKVVVAYPGVTRTELSARAGGSGPKPFSTLEGPAMSPEYVADRIVAAYLAGRPEAYIPPVSRIYRWLCAASPRLLDAGLRSLYKRKGWL